VFRLVSKDGKDTVEAVQIRAGRKLGDLREISGGGLHTGDKLVLEPSKELKPGARVTLAGV